MVYSHSILGNILRNLYVGCHSKQLQHFARRRRWVRTRIRSLTAAEESLPSPEVPASYESLVESVGKHSSDMEEFLAAFKAQAPASEGLGGELDRAPTPISLLSRAFSGQEPEPREARDLHAAIVRAAAAEVDASRAAGRSAQPGAESGVPTVCADYFLWPYCLEIATCGSFVGFCGMPNI